MKNQKIPLPENLNTPAEAGGGLDTCDDPLVNVQVPHLSASSDK
jgi:hypothetical protein